MKIEVLLKRAKFDCTQEQKEQLQSDIDRILELVVQIPAPKRNYEVNQKCVLAKDEYNKRANRADLLAAEMFTFRT